jgi:hypothetical protein
VKATAPDAEGGNPPKTQVPLVEPTMPPEQVPETGVPPGPEAWAIPKPPFALGLASVIAYEISTWRAPLAAVPEASDMEHTWAGGGGVGVGTGVGVGPGVGSGVGGGVGGGGVGCGPPGGGTSTVPVSREQLPSCALASTRKRAGPPPSNVQRQTPDVEPVNDAPHAPLGVPDPGPVTRDSEYPPNAPELFRETEKETSA